MPYWQLYYHAVWATKYREPTITPDIEPIIYGYLRSKANDLGATVFALNGVADHIHLVVAIPPKIAVAKFIGQVKAVASTKLNKGGVTASSFYWQEEYAVFSFDKKRLPNFIAYVDRQKEHHARKSVIPILEVADEPVSREMRDEAQPYTIDQDEWLHEMLTLSDGA